VKFLQCIAGLDLSLTGTGIATFTHGNVAVQTIDGTLSRRKDEDPVDAAHKRLQTILTAVGDLRHFDLVLIEDVFRGVKGDTALRLAELHGLVKHWLWLRGIPYVLVNNTAIKQYAVGKGSGPDTGKDPVLLAVERRYGHLVAVGDNNQADALLLVAIGLDHYGVPLVGVPETYKRALVKVTGWPALEAAEASDG
jgi:crossover junction endodeoxyribonuclease RuvC